MSVNIFGGARNGGSASHASVSVVSTAGNLNQRLIMLSNKLSQKVNKSGDTMNGDLKLKFKPDSSCVSLSFGVDGIDRDWSMSLLLGNIHNQIYHANRAPVTLIAQHGFLFKCSEGRTTTFDHDIQLQDKHITGLIDPESPSGAVTKQYSDGKLALAVNELIRKIYLNTASLSNLQTDMISRIEAQSSAAVSANSNQDEKIREMLDKIESNVSSIVSLRQETTELLRTNVSSLQTDMISRIDAERTAAASVHSNYNEKIVEVLGKIELNVTSIASLRQETTELLNTTRTAIEADHEQKMSTVRGRQQEIIDNITANQRSLNLLRTRQNDLKIVVDATKFITDDLVARINTTRFVKNNVGLVPRLTATPSKEFTATATHNSNDAWKVFNASTYYWNPGVHVDEQGEFLTPVSIQIRLPTATRIHRFGLRTRSDTDKIKRWLLQGKNEDGSYRIVYNPQVHFTNSEDRFIGGTVKYFDVPFRTSVSYQYYSLEITEVNSRNCFLNYFQLFSLDEVIEMPISSDGSYINVG